VAYLSAVQPDLIFRQIQGAGHWVCYEAADAFKPFFFEMLDVINSRK
jgi:hypothetical protein